MNKKKYVHINNAEKLHNIHHGLIIKTLDKFGRERDAPQGIYEKSTDNMKFNGKKSNSFPLRSGIWQEYTDLSFL